MIKIQTLLWQTNTLNTWFHVGFQIHVNVRDILCHKTYVPATIQKWQYSTIYQIIYTKIEPSHPLYW